jgi:choloylglycine hydrolase
MTFSNTKVTRTMLSFRRAKLVFAALCTIAWAIHESRACTGITLKAKDGAVVYGRTMEWGSFDLNSRLVTAS